MMALPKVFLKLLKRKEKELSIAFPFDLKLVPLIGSPVVFDGKKVGEVTKVNKKKNTITAVIKDEKIYDKFYIPKNMPISMGCRIIEEREIV